MQAYGCNTFTENAVATFRWLDLREQGGTACMVACTTARFWKSVAG